MVEVLICLALTKQKVEELNLPLMSSLNKARMQTAFTISIEATKGNYNWNISI